jgi:hypothetical protein
MDLDFSKLTGAQTSDTLIDPREIFASLPAKDHRYSYLRDVQSEVLDAWFQRRSESDLRLKMNTGGGKTLVGLLLLKSSLNEGVGPAVYIAPTPFLVNQVVAEAKKLGLSVDTDPQSLNVARGKSILVTSIKVLLNGRSQFGVAPETPKLEIGSLVLDDAHACLGAADEQFTVILPSSSEAYKGLLGLFSQALDEQSSSRFLEVKSGEPDRFAMVPFWTWQKKIKEVEEILYTYTETDELKFTWPLVRDYLRFGRCVFGNKSVEVSLPCLPISVIPSFGQAQRRIFMSATFDDDSVLITHFDANSDAITTAIAPKNASDLGERMILVPQELDPNITDDEIRDYAEEQSKIRNVVVIVPSKYRSKFWEDVADKIVPPENLQSAVDGLVAGHVGLVVFVNRYDGIDLPQDACRLLILDGVPDVRRMIDKLEQACLHGTALSTTRSVQMIEQGMGRGIRANDDHCAVLLMGRSLVGALYRNNGISKLTPATRTQYDLSEQIGNQIRGKGMAGVSGALDYCFKRKQNWVGAAKAGIAQVKYVTAAADLSLAKFLRGSFNFASERDYAKASEQLQEAKNQATESVVKGWLGWQLAEIRGFTDPMQAQQILNSAFGLNKQLPIRPHIGISYTRIGDAAKSQAETCLELLRRQFPAANDLLVGFNSVLDDLEFRPDSFERFERALDALAPLLGFESQRPEKEYGAGPDILWALGGLSYLVIECKNEATVDTISKTYTNQLAGSVNWFEKTYDRSCTSSPMMIHPARKFEYAATPPDGTRVMDAVCLTLFRDSIRQFATSMSRDFRVCEVNDVAHRLAILSLLRDQIFERFTKEPEAAR